MVVILTAECPDAAARLAGESVAAADQPQGAASLAIIAAGSGGNATIPADLGIRAAEVGADTPVGDARLAVRTANLAIGATLKRRETLAPATPRRIVRAGSRHIVGATHIDRNALPTTTLLP